MSVQKDTYGTSVTLRQCWNPKNNPNNLNNSNNLNNVVVQI